MRRSGRSSRRRLSLPLTSHGLQIFLSFCGAAASLSVPGASLAARRGPLTRGDGTALVSCLSEPMSSVSSLTYTAAACSSLDRGSHGQRSIYSHLPLGPNLGALHFQCRQLFIVRLVFGRQHFFHSSSFFFTWFPLLSSGYFTGTTNAHQPRNLFPLPPFFNHPRSARFRATRLVPYLTPSATAMEKQKREEGSGQQQQQQQTNSETAPHGKGEQGTWVFWRCILTTDFPFSSLFL